MRRLQPSSKGFTVVELLVVVAIMLILSGMLLPVIMQARERALQTVCASNQRQIIAATLLYTQDNDYRFPISTPTNPGWTASVSPYAADASIWHCPAALSAKGISYSVNPRLMGVIAVGRFDDTRVVWSGDGFEDTTTGHVASQFGLAQPTLRDAVGGIGFRHSETALFVHLDGHVRPVKRGENLTTLLSLSR